jgi:hypothetical protein
MFTGDNINPRHPLPSDMPGWAITKSDEKTSAVTMSVADCAEGEADEEPEATLDSGDAD